MMRHVSSRSAGLIVLLSMSAWGCQAEPSTEMQQRPVLVPTPAGQPAPMPMQMAAAASGMGGAMVVPQTMPMDMGMSMGMDMDMPMDAEAAQAPEDLSVVPDLLSETGLYVDTPGRVLGEGVRFYAPKYALWTDGADKARWLRLPPDTQIDTSDLDRWRFPVGTKIWKEFAKDGVPLETRYMAKYGPDGMDWVFMAYQWEADGSDAIAVPFGVENTAGTEHDIPDDLTCLKCHEGLPDGALGVSAIQLSHEMEGLTLAGLGAEGLLTNPVTGDLRIPGDAVAEQALGYLHGNCGHCHNPTGGEAYTKNATILFWQESEALGSVEETSTYTRMVTETGGDLELLQLSVDRMRSRPDMQMPPVGTEVVDDRGSAIVEAWVQRLVDASR
jgi:hypothetical protein